MPAPLSKSPLRSRKTERRSNRMRCRMGHAKIFAAALLLGGAAVPSLDSQAPNAESVDYGMISALRQQELDHSQALDHVSWLADVYGPRVTGSPNFKAAQDWAMKKFREWGLTNVHREYFPFGYGWSLARFSAHMTEPQYQPLIGFPKAWTPGTGKPVESEVVRVDIKSEADFQKYRGKLSGKIVLSQPARAVDMLTGTIVQRWTPELLKEAETTPLVGPVRSRTFARLLRPRFSNSLKTRASLPFWIAAAMPSWFTAIIRCPG